MNMPAPTETRKSILIVKAQSTSLSGVEQFLRNREWKIQSTTNLKEALTYLVSQKPSFVMISTDHPNKKVRGLPKILNQAFPVFVMVFSESNSTVAYKNLIESGCPYRINPPATGPAVERTINKIMKDQEMEKERQSLRAAGHAISGAMADAKDNEGNSSFSAGGPQGSGISHIQGGAGPIDAGQMDSISAILKQMADDEADANGASPVAEASSESASNSEAGMWVPVQETEKPGNGGTKAPSLLPHEDSAAADSSEPGTLSPSTGQRRPADSAEAPENFGTVDVAKDFTKDRPVARYDEEDIIDRTAPSKEPGAAPINRERNKKQEGPSSRSTMEDGGPAPGLSGKWQGSTEGQLIRAGGPGSRNAGSGGESIIVRGAQQALQDSVQVGDGVVQQKLENSSNVACLIVESPRFSGYLVAALGRNRPIDEQFINQIKLRLFKFLKDNGEAVSEEGTMNLKIKQVDFEDWSMECADFLRKSVHNGEEIAMAFFPYENAKTAVKDSASVEMGAVDVKEIKPDVELDFNLYIYLEVNQKYVLYTPQGAKFYSNQKDRLLQMGVSQVHVKRSELKSVDKYRAQNYLNSKIDQYQNKKKGPLSDAS